jgi:hypothetical protein
VSVIRSVCLTLWESSVLPVRPKNQGFTPSF